jgi:hypothetical protein
MPRYSSYPDCKGYSFVPVQRKVVEKCEPDLIGVSVSQPHMPGFFVVRWTRVESGNLEFELFKTFVENAPAPQSKEFGTLVFENGKPSYFDLGDAHLPLEFPGRRAVLMK